MSQSMEGSKKQQVVSSVFQSYDRDGDGAVNEADVAAGLADLSAKHKLGLSVESIEKMTKSIFDSAQLANGKMSQDDWNRLQVAADSRRRVSVAYNKEKHTKTFLRKMCNFIHSYQQQIIWLFIFYALQVLLFGLGVERYIRERPSTGRPFSVASMVAISFGHCLRIDCAILLLFPAFRWTVGVLRRTFISQFIPFDSWISFHIVLGFTVCTLGIAHVVVFVIHFWRSTSRPGSKNTLAQYLFQSGILGHDFLGFTAISGWVAIACLLVITFFALPPVRNSACFDAFYWTHKLQLVFWAALIVHEEEFWKYFVGPFVLYVLEKLHKYINAFRWSSTTHITQVTHLSIKRPHNFKYNPGDYIFIKIPAIGLLSWHPFTLSSPPELTESIWLHIKASGNWTRALNQHFQEPRYRSNGPLQNLFHVNDSEKYSDIPLQSSAPTISRINVDMPVLLDGPYGASTTALFNAKHAVLIGAGIGVTPFASILGSILAQLNAMNCQKCTNHFPAGTPPPSLCINRRGLKLKKLDFIWVCREQTSIQWFIDLLQGWEKQQEALPNNYGQFMDCQIFITKIPNKQSVDGEGLSLGMDLHWQAHKKDAMTGLRTITQTGRPNWPVVFDKIECNKKGPVRVFYCGPITLQREIRWLCGQYKFKFSWENF